MAPAIVDQLAMDVANLHALAIARYACFFHINKVALLDGRDASRSICSSLARGISSGPAAPLFLRFRVFQR